LIDIASRQPDVFDFPQVQSVGQVELLEMLLTTLGSARLTEPTLHELTLQGHSRIVQIAEEYALSHTSERVHVTDLCEAAGVSERTLQYAFKELLGLTPMAYLTRLRLHRARQSMRAASHASTTVAQEALRWGFWHFGDFSRAYKQCFGELPSDTLRGSANQRGND
jgi:transcriptional regulator GlxA family with amidase domain